MLSIRYFILGVFLAGSFATNSRAEVTEKAGSWKYLVERTTTEWDKLTEKKQVHIDRAFVHYGAGVEDAGGQKKGIPGVVYIGENGNRLAKAAYYGPPIIPRRDAKKFELLNEIPEGIGSERNRPLPVSIVANNFPILPLKPEGQLKEGLEWSRQVYMCFVVRKLWFSATINHKMIGYQRKQGRSCMVIEYKLAGELKTAEHPSRFAEEEGRGLRGEYGLKGHGKAYFDAAEETIVEKEQTLSWTRHGERGRRLGDGRVEWVATQDLEESVDILVSLQPQEGGAGGLPPAAYVLIIGGAGTGIAAVVLLRKKKASTRGA